MNVQREEGERHSCARPLQCSTKLMVIPESRDGVSVPTEDKEGKEDEEMANSKGSRHTHKKKKRSLPFTPSHTTSLRLSLPDVVFPFLFDPLLQGREERRRMEKNGLVADITPIFFWNCFCLPAGSKWGFQLINRKREYQGK